MIKMTYDEPSDFGPVTREEWIDPKEITQFAPGAAGLVVTVRSDDRRFRSTLSRNELGLVVKAANGLPIGGSR